MIWEKFLFGPMMDESSDGDAGGEGAGDSGDPSDDDSSDVDSDDSDDSDGDDDSDDDDEKDDEEDELTEEEVNQSKQLFKLLKNPATSTETLRLMAKQAGVLGDNVPETKKEEAQAKKAIVAILEEEFGKDLDFLTGKMSKALDRIFAQERKEQEDKISELQRTSIESKTEAALNRLNKKTNGESRKYEAKMAKLMDQIIQRPGTSLDDYFQILYDAASAGSKAASTKSKIADKINRNAKDAPGRLSGKSGERGNLRDLNKKLTSGEAAQAAFDKIFGKQG